MIGWFFLSIGRIGTIFLIVKARVTRFFILCRPKFGWGGFMHLEKDADSGLSESIFLGNVSRSNYSKIKFWQLFPVIESSLDDNRCWVNDFETDEIYVPNDLHDVITAYEHFYSKIKDTKWSSRSSNFEHRLNCPELRSKDPRRFFEIRYTGKLSK